LNPSRKISIFGKKTLACIAGKAYRTGTNSVSHNRAEFGHPEFPAIELGGNTLLKLPDLMLSASMHHHEMHRLSPTECLNNRTIPANTFVVIQYYA
jgi:hypothetical protein